MHRRRQWCVRASGDAGQKSTSLIRHTSVWGRCWRWLVFFFFFFWRTMAKLATGAKDRPVGL